MVKIEIASKTMSQFQVVKSPLGPLGPLLVFSLVLEYSD